MNSFFFISFRCVGTATLTRATRILMISVRNYYILYRNFHLEMLWMYISYFHSFENWFATCFHILPFLLISFPLVISFNNKCTGSGSRGGMNNLPLRITTFLLYWFEVSHNSLTNTSSYRPNPFWRYTSKRVPSSAPQRQLNATLVIKWSGSEWRWRWIFEYEWYLWGGMEHRTVTTFLRLYTHPSSFKRILELK